MGRKVKGQEVRRETIEPDFRQEAKTTSCTIGALMLWVATAGRLEDPVSNKPSELFSLK